jgi:hypothetical protein
MLQSEAAASNHDDWLNDNACYVCLRRGSSMGPKVCALCLLPSHPVCLKKVEETIGESASTCLGVAARTRLLNVCGKIHEEYMKAESLCTFCQEVVQRPSRPSSN